MKKLLTIAAVAAMTASTSSWAACTASIDMNGNTIVNGGVGYSRFIINQTGVQALAAGTDRDVFSHNAPNVFGPTNSYMSYDSVDGELDLNVPGYLCFGVIGTQYIDTSASATSGVDYNHTIVDQADDATLIDIEHDIDFTDINVAHYPTLVNLRSGEGQSNFAMLGVDNDTNGDILGHRTSFNNTACATISSATSVKLFVNTVSADKSYRASWVAEFWPK